MIPIKHHKLEYFVERHAISVIDYLKNRTKPKNTLENINKWLKTNFSNIESKIDLYYVLIAKPNVLNNIYEKCIAQKINFDLTFLNYIRDNLYKNVFPNKNDGFEFKGKSYSAYQLISDLEISVCPYCNRNFIYNVDEKRTCELDHFYPESKFPFLAMSFYNLIPSCGTCNHFKSSTVISYNPYCDEIKLLDKRFKLKILGTEFYNKKNDIEIEIIEDNLKENINLFHLKNLYKEHSDIALELIKKKNMYSDDYIEILFKQYEGTLFKNKEQLIGMVLGNYISDDELSKRPLAKLTRDIAEELGLI